MNFRAPMTARVHDREGRWCCAEVWTPKKGFGACGGEQLIMRRHEGDELVTYLQCQFCGALTRTMAYNLETAALTICGEAG